MKPHINILNKLLKKEIETLEKHTLVAIESLVQPKIDNVAKEPVKREAEGLFVELKSYQIKGVFERIHKHQKKTLEFTSSLKLTQICVFCDFIQQ